MHAKIPLHPAEDVYTTTLKMTANAVIEHAAELVDGKEHTPTFHADGWKIAIETPRGIIGLWSCWLGNKFHLGYPGPSACPESVTLVDRIIRVLLEVEPAEAVLQVDATAVESNYTGKYKDADKPLEVNKLGQIIAYQTQGPRRWASYCGPRVSSDTQEPGRVWIEHANFSSTTSEFRLVTPIAPNPLSTILYGHDTGWNIYTYPFTFANRYAPEGPTAQPAHIQAYRDRFLALASCLAQALGGARAVHIDYGFVTTPAQLRGLGYEDIRWIKGSPDNYLGWGNEVVLAGRQHSEYQFEHLLLQSGNQLVPWAAIRRLPTRNNLTVQTLLDLLTF
jgi:hypothetical protein